MHDRMDGERSGVPASDLDPFLSRQVMRYVAGECSVTEVAELERRIIADPVLAEHVRTLREVWMVSERPKKRRDIEHAWGALREQLDEAPAVSVERTPSRYGAGMARLRRGGRVAAIAAALVAVALPAAIAWRLTHGVEKAGTAPSTASRHEYATQTGERAELRLPDGSRVILGAASRLRLADGFGRGARDVTLDGEAYFDVVHDEAHPFRVTTLYGVAEDIGTAFVVTNYPEINGMRVIVASGIVALAKPGETSDRQLLRVGDLGRLDAAGDVQVEHAVDVEARLAWTRGELVFRRTPLREVLAQVERWYGVRVNLADRSLGDVPVSASFAGETPGQVVSFLAASVSARLAREASGADSVFTFHSR